MAKVTVLVTAHDNDPGTCSHDHVDLLAEVGDGHPHCYDCRQPVMVTDELAFDLFYERDGREAARRWEPACPTCGEPMAPWAGKAGHALVCTVGDEDDCPPVQWSDTAIGLFTLHALAMCEGVR